MMVAPLQMVLLGCLPNRDAESPFGSPRKPFAVARDVQHISAFYPAIDSIR
jgi:hypothetical protein